MLQPQKPVDVITYPWPVFSESMSELVSLKRKGRQCDTAPVGFNVFSDDHDDG